MKKFLSMILALMIVLSLGSSAFAANEGLKMTYKPGWDNGLFVATYEFRDANGNLIREERDKIGMMGMLVNKQIRIYDEKGNMTYQRDAGYSDKSTWKDEETVRTKDSNGTVTENTRVAFIKQDGNNEYWAYSGTVKDDDTITLKGEIRDKNGVKLYDYSEEYLKDDNGIVSNRTFKYADGREHFESTTDYHDETQSFTTVDTNADGKKTAEFVQHTKPDGSYETQYVNYSYRSDGKVVQTTETAERAADGSVRVEGLTYITDSNGEGFGRGKVYDKFGRQVSTVTVELRNDGDEGYVTASTYKNADGTIDMRYIVTKDGKVITDDFKEDVRDQDGDDSESENTNWDEFDELDAEKEKEKEEHKDTFDAWKEAFADQADDVNGESAYDWSAFEEAEAAAMYEAGWDDYAETMYGEALEDYGWNYFEDSYSWDNTGWDDYGWEGSGWEAGGWDDYGWGDFGWNYFDNNTGWDDYGWDDYGWEDVG